MNILAALVWYTGGIVLLIKGSSLLMEAHAMKPVVMWTFMVVLIGLTIGSVKAKFIFSKSCHKNLARIAALTEPQIWQFYRPQFFLFLILMIALGASLSRMAHNNYAMLIGVTILDYSIAIALLGSSYVYWQQKAFWMTENTG